MTVPWSRQTYEASWQYNSEDFSFKEWSRKTSGSCLFFSFRISLFICKVIFFNHLTSQNTAVLWVKQPCVSEIGALPSDEPWSQETPKEFLSRIALTSAAGEGSSVVISTNIFFSVKDLIHGLTHAMKAPYYWATFLALHVFVWIFLYAWDLDLNCRMGSPGKLNSTAAFLIFKSSLDDITSSIALPRARILLCFL